MTVISTSDLTLRFGMTTIFESVSFALEENDKMGLIGVNGSGKTSLFRTILGEYTPESGHIYIAKDKSVGYLAQDTISDDPRDATQSLLERMYDAFSSLLETERQLNALEAQMQTDADPQLAARFSALHDRFVRDGGLEFRARCASILQKLGFDAEAQARPVATLSGGQRTRLALAVQLGREPDVLLLDEPTNHLDIETMRWLEGFLANWHKCVLVISHDRYFLDRVTNKTLVLEYGRAKLYGGNYSATQEMRRADRAAAQKAYDKQAREIAHHEAVIEQQRRWGQEHNFVTIRARQKIIDRIERVERPREAPKPIKMRFTASIASGNDVLTVKNLTMGFGGAPLFENLSFLLKREERMFIIGPNGCGKSTLIKLILGALEPIAGKIEAGYNVEVGYYDQENQNLTPENTVLDELWNAYPTLTETEIRNTLGLFRFTGDEVFKTVSVLSGGQRARLTLAKLILSKMNLLILDEPTNHLDIDSREALETALSGFPGTVLIVSHDRYFIDKLATRIFEISPGAAFPGPASDYHVDRDGQGYTEYMAFKDARLAALDAAAPDAASPDSPPMSAGKEQYLKNKKETADARRRQHRIEKLHEEAATLEDELAQVEKDLFGDAATDYQKVAELDSRKNEIEDRLLEIYGELEELEA